MTRLLALGLTILAVVGVPSARNAHAQGEDNQAKTQAWPRFRGATGDGQAPDAKPATSWDAKKNITWRVEIPGKGWSSPVVGQGKIYLTSAVPKNVDASASQSLRALCLDAQKGTIIWNKEVFLQDGKSAPSIHSKNSHASPTPILEGDKLYVHFGHMGTACLQAKDGEKIWATQKLRYQPQHGNGGSPLFVGDHLCFNIDGHDLQAMVALEKTTGNLAWKTTRDIKTERKKFSFCTPTLIHVDGKPQLISVGSGVVMALEPNKGKEIWRVTFKGFSVVPKPLFAHGLVFICTGYARAGLLAIKPNGQGNVTKSHVAYTIKRSVPLNPSLLAVDDALYMVSDNGILSCVDAKTGTVRWTQRMGGNFSASPIYANGMVYVTNEAGTTTVFKPGARYQEVAKNQIDERTLASLAVMKNTLFLRTEKALYRIDEK